MPLPHAILVCDVFLLFTRGKKGEFHMPPLGEEEVWAIQRFFSAFQHRCPETICTLNTNGKRAGSLGRLYLLKRRVSMRNQLFIHSLIGAQKYIIETETLNHFAAPMSPFA